MKHLSWIITLPVTLLAVVFAVANRQMTELDLWPLALTIRLPLFLMVLGSLVFGLLVGGLAAWLSGAGTRRRARAAERRAGELEREVSRLRSEAQSAPAQPASGAAGLPAPARPPEAGHFSGAAATGT